MCSTRSCLYNKQSAIKCLWLIWSRRIDKWGRRTFLGIRKPLVILVWPMRSLLRTVSSLRLGSELIKRWIFLLILFNLVFPMFQIHYHLFFVYSYMSFFGSSFGIWFIKKVSLLLMVIEACSSATIHCLLFPSGQVST